MAVAVKESLRRDELQVTADKGRDMNNVFIKRVGCSPKYECVYLLA